MGGQMQQTNAAAAAAAAATALYDHTAAGGSLHNPATTSDAGDAVMARWLQSAGLQHLASPVASTGIDHRLLPNLLMQGYGAQSAEEKQRLFKLMRNLNFNGESGSEPYTPTSQTSAGMGASDGFYSSDFRGDFGAGLLDLHAMDDTELLSDHVMSEPFETSPFMPDVSQGFENKSSMTSSRQQKEQFETDPSIPTEKENSTRENNVAKIKVVVRKRPLNKKELSRKEDDVVTVGDNSLTVHETKLKVDLTAYVEKHEFCFDAVLDEHVTNDEVYRSTVEPIIPIIFQRTKATCFAYGQTGSGKTFTMQPLPLRAAADLVRLLHQPVYRNQKFKLWLSFFEIYGGKLYDLLSDRKKLCMREDGRQQVCIVGLQEFEVSDVQIVKEFIEKGNACRSTGSTGANEESSRSHAILQLAVKKHNEVKESRRNNNYDVNEAKNGRLVGKISFIDLAGSERGADTTDNDRQTRIEGAEINKSLLALKECIRALDNDQLHIPFRGSKLTEVLRDSFVGNSRTVMISCISPNEGSCEHTLNTLRYADRVKSLSKSGNSKKDQTVNTNKDASLASTQNVSADVDDSYEQQPAKAMDMNRRVVEKETASYIPTVDYDRQSSGYAVNGREGSGLASGPADRERLETNSSNVGSASTSHRVYSSSSQNPVDADEKVQKVSPPRRKSAREEKSEGTSTSTSQRGVYSSSTQNPVDAEEKVPKVSPPRRKTSREEKAEKSGNNWLRKDSGADSSSTTPRSQNTVNYSASTAPQSTLSYNGNTTLQNANTVGSRRTVPEPPSDAGNYNANGVGSRRTVPDPPSDGNINAILEEEEALIAAHRKEIEDTMEIVREEMKLLAEVDRPGSLVDNYVTQLSFVLSRKAASLVSLQARLARFQHRLKEQEILSRKRVHR